MNETFPDYINQNYSSHFYLLFLFDEYNIKLEKNPNPTLNNTCTISGFVLDRKTKNRLLERYKPYSKSNIVFEANFRYSINVELVFDLWVNDYLFSKRKSAE